MYKISTILFSLFLTSALAQQHDDLSKFSTFTVQIKETRVLYENIKGSRIGDQVILSNFRTNNREFEYIAGTKENAHAICELQDLAFHTYETEEMVECRRFVGCFSKPMRTSVIDGETGDISDTNTTSHYLTEVVCKVR